MISHGQSLLKFNIYLWPIAKRFSLIILKRQLNAEMDVLS